MKYVKNDSTLFGKYVTNFYDSVGSYKHPSRYEIYGLVS